MDCLGRGSHLLPHRAEEPANGGIELDLGVSHLSKRSTADFMSGVSADSLLFPCCRAPFAPRRPMAVRRPPRREDDPVSKKAISAWRCASSRNAVGEGRLAWMKTVEQLGSERTVQANRAVLALNRPVRAFSKFSGVVSARVRDRLAATPFFLDRSTSCRSLLLS